MKKRILSLILTVVTVLGLLPAGVTVSAAEDVPEPIKIDFMETAKRMAQEPWWADLPDAKAVSAGTPTEGMKYISGNMDAAQRAAYQSLLGWLEENENWSIDEGYSKFSEGWLNKRMHLNAGSADWGLRLWTNYLDEGNYASQVKLKLQIPAAGEYVMKLSVFNENGSINYDMTSGGGYGDVFIGGTQVLDRYHFHSTGNEAVTLNLGKVTLTEGENELLLDMLCDSFGGKASGDRAAILRYVELIPVDGMRETVLEGSRLVVDLKEDYLRFDEEVSATSHEAVVSDADTVTAEFDESGKLILRGKAVGSAEVAIVKDGETLCTVFVTVAEDPDAAEPEQFKLDFMGTVKAMKAQSFWAKLPDATAVSAGAPVEDVKYINGNMSDTQRAAYEELLAWLAQNANWQIDEEKSIFAETWVGKRLHLNAGKADWGLRMWTSYLGEGNNASQNTITFNAPAGGVYTMVLSLYNENGATNMDMSCGGGYGNVSVSGKKVLDNYRFYAPAEQAVALNLGDVELDRGRNELVIEMLTDAFGGSGSADRAAILRYVEFIPKGGRAPEQVLEGNRLLVELNNNYAPYFEEVSAKTHKAASQDEAIATAVLTESGILKIYGHASGIAKIAVTTLDGEETCTVSVEVLEREGEKPVPETFRVDFMATVREMAKEPFWQELKESSAGAHIRTVGNWLNEGDAMTDSQRAAYGEMLTWLDETRNWRIDESRTALLNDALSKRILFNAGAMDFGLRLHPGRYLNAMPASTFYIVVDAPATGEYNFTMSLHNESGSLNIDTACGGGYGDLYVNGEKIYDRYWFYADTAQAVTLSFGVIELDEGENTIAIDILADRYGTDTIGDTGAILRYMEFTPKTSERLYEFTQKTVDLTSFYLPFDAAVSPETHSVVSQNESIVTASLDANGHLTLSGIIPGETAVTVFAGEKALCTVPVTVLEFAGDLDELGGKSVELDFAHFAGKLAALPLWDSLTATDRETVKKISDLAPVQAWLSENLRWSVEKADGLLVDAASVHAGIETAGEAAFTVDIPVDGPYTVAVQGVSGTADIYVDGECFYEALPVAGLHALGQAILTAGDHTVTVVGAAKLSKIAFQPLGTRAVELGRDVYLDLTETYLPFDAAVSATVTVSDKNAVSASFSEDGELVIAGKKQGTAVLTVRAGEKTFTVPVRVVEPGKLQTLQYLLNSSGALTLEVGDTAEGILSATTTNDITLGEKQLRNYGAVYFLSDNTAAVTVDQASGDITAVGEGSATVTAYAAMDGTTVRTAARVSVTDETDLAALAISSEVPYLGTENTMQLTVTGRKASGVHADMSLYPLTWRVDDETVAMVTQDGKLRGLQPGEVTVTATACVRDVEVTASVSVTVIDNRDLETSEVYIDMMQDRCFELPSVTLEQQGWALNRELTHEGGGTITYTDSNGPRVKLPEGGHFAVDFMVKKSGWYHFELNGTTMPAYLAGAADAYLDDAYMGAVDFRKGPRQGLPAYLIEKMNTVYLEAGVHTLDLVCTYAGTLYPSRYALRPVKAVEDLHISVTADMPLLVGSTVGVEPLIRDSNGNKVHLKNAEGGINTYTLSSGNGNVSVDGGTIRGEKVGTSTVTVTMDIGGEIHSRTVEAVVEEGTVLSADLTAETRTANPTLTDSIQLTFTANTVYGASDMTADATYVSADPNIAQVDETGLVTFGGTLGSVTVTASVVDGGREISGSVWLTFTEGKTEPTLYTNEERAIAQENVKKYTWAWQMKEDVVSRADFYVENVEHLFNAWIREGLPRSIQVGLEYDTRSAYCRYCGVDLQNIYGHYPWEVDVIGNPWKVTCPVCDRSFPTNDFESYYKCGLDERGYFSKERALANGGEQYLVNELYPEMGPDWGVDDGWGYKGADSAPTYIAHYVHNVFRSLGDFAPHSMCNVLNDLRDAYLYTGDEKYGNAGAILTLRVAEIYPEYDLNLYNTAEWYNADGGAGMGKMIGYIWEADWIGQSLPRAADAFWDCMDHAEVLDFVKKEAVFFGVEEEAVTPQYLRDLVDNGILLEIKDACETAQSWGNFGMHQTSMAAAAVALDRMPETREMIEWIFKAELLAGSGRDMTNDGGDIWRYITNQVDRDGLGDEVSYQYNALLPDDILTFAETLAGYDKVESADLWKNQKFVNFCWSIFKLNVCGNMMAQVGEAGAVQSQYFPVNQDTMLTAFIRTKDPDIAKAVYAANGNSVEGLHGDIFTKDPESGIRAEILKIVREQGEWDMSQSDMMSGFGIAILREGPSKFLGKNVNGHEFFDYWMYFGRTAGAGHEKSDALHLDMEAFGLNLSGNMGYPLHVDGSDPERQQWVRNTASHNTVVVDGHGQTELTWGGEPRHFADNGYVKVMDADATNAYPETDIYRRTVVAVDNGDGVHYAVDFFRILGGSEHVYSFHGVTDVDPVTEALSLVDQPVGSYAGPDVPFGPWNKNEQADIGLSRGAGFSWLYGVSRDASPAASFSVDFAIRDFQHRLTTSSGIHMKLHMVSDEPLDEVALANGRPPQNGTNPTHLEYVLVKNSGENGLDTLFTSVIEPYQHSAYVDTVERVEVELTDGTEGASDTAAAVKVTLKTGRTDYIVYATNSACTYRVADLFDFCGFTGVVSYEDGQITYAWGSEATTVAGAIEGAAPVITGRVADFTEGLSLDGYTVTVETEQPVTAEMFDGAYLFVENNTSNRNAAYRIYGAEVQGNTVTLDLHTQTLVRAMADTADPDAGYIHNISVGDRYRIPLSSSFDVEDLFTYTTDRVVKVGDQLSLTTGVAGRTYEIEGLPIGAKFEGRTGQIVWTPSRTQVGKYPITVKTEGSEMSFVLYAVNYTGSTYAPSVCTHAKAVTFEGDTVCPACGTIVKQDVQPESKLVFAGSNMTLGNELEQNFMVVTSDLKDGYKALITHNGKTVEAEFSKYNKTYSCVSYSVAAKEMTDVIEVVVVDAEGNAVSEVYTSSVRDYAMKALTAASSTSKVKTMVVDMLNYGAAAQTHFGYKTEDLANAKLTESQKAWATGDVECTDRRVQGKNYYGSNLSLEDKILLNLYFKNCTDAMTAKVSFTDYTGKSVTVDAELVQYSGKIYKVEVDEIVLADAFSDVTVTVYDGETVHGTATDSVESYVARSEGSDLYVSILKFATSAKNYFS